MNAIFDSGSPSSDQQSVARLYAGQGPVHMHVSAYTVLLPSDEALDPATVARAVVADVLQRNGRVVDADTLDAMVTHARTHWHDAEGRPLLGEADWRLHPGMESADGQPGTPFLGHALSVDAGHQQALLTHAGDWVAQRDAAGPPPVDDLIAQLRALAAGAGQDEVVKTLDAVQRGLEGGRQADAAGQPLGEAALRGVLEFASGMGKEREAAKVLERYTAIKGVASDARELGRNAGRVFNGRDPLTGKPLDTDARVESAFDLLNGGFRLAGNVGSTALLLGARASGWAGTLIGIAPAGAAIVAFAAGAFELIKRAREALLAPRWDEFRERFPFAEDIAPKRAVSKVLRLIEGMPEGPDNAAATCERITALLGENPDTRARFFAFLRQKAPSDDLVAAMAAGTLRERDPTQIALMASLAKDSAREFLDLEMKDVKHYVRDRDGDRARGAYLLPEDQRHSPYTGARLHGDLQEGMRVAALLTSSAHALNGLYTGMLEQIRGNAELKSLDAQQQKNLAAAAVAGMQQHGLERADHLVISRDGSRLFAIQGDPQSDHRRMSSLDIHAASRQSVEASSRQVAAAPAIDPSHAATPSRDQPPREV